MNPTHKNNPHAEEDAFDRLVDGELSELERRSLLASLDTEPEGWRRCALAFLEAQTFRESFGDFTPPASAPAKVPAPAVSSSLPKRKRPLGAMGTVMAMAASFLLMFGLGGWLLQRPPQDGASSPLGPANNMVANNARPATIMQMPNVSANGNQTIRQPKTVPSTPWQMVSLRAPALTGNDQPLQLPAMPRERLDEDFLDAVPNPMPDGVRQAFERTGHEIRMHRELVPVQLQDGRQLIVPIDQVDVHYDAHWAN
jgi:hypothetical protein